MSEPRPEQPINRLQDLILTRLLALGDESGPMSVREAARRAEGLISYETLRNLARGVRHSGRLTDRVAEGLAVALQIPQAKVYEVMGSPMPGQPWRWPDRFGRLGPRQRALVEDVASAILESYEQGRRDAEKSPEQ